MENGFLVSFSILNVISIFAIFIPLAFALYLYFSRITLSFVNKKILLWGSSAASFASFVLFIALYFLFVLYNQEVNFGFNFINLGKISLDFGISIDKSNSVFLIFAAFLSFLISIYSKFYFDKKKRFIFTKQRYFAFLNLISFLVYLFFASLNLIQGIIACSFLSALIFVFSYFDIFKNPTNHNIVRFYRIDLISNFFLLLAGLILFKYSILSQGYIELNSLDYKELNVLVSYMYGICSPFEFEIMSGCFLVALFAKFAIFPFSCYWSFYTNSSNLLYLISISLINNLIAAFIFLKIMPIFALFSEYRVEAAIVLFVFAVMSLLQLLYEKNIKILFGYLNSILAIGFVFSYMIFRTEKIVLLYFLSILLMSIILMTFFYFDKISFKRRLINKQAGFFLEKMHIVLFENLPSKINKVFNLISEKIVQNFVYGFILIFDYLTSLFVIKTIRKNETKCVKYILIIFAIFALLAVFIALFGRYKC